MNVQSTNVQMTKYWFDESLAFFGSTNGKL
jgi:hypothetical protein